MALYAADGSWNVTVVDGSTYTGLYAPDGSYNVVVVDGTAPVGLYHACGAYNAVESDGRTGFLHPCGALNVSVDPYVEGSVKVTGFVDTAPTVTALSPLDNATGVEAYGFDATVTFNKNVQFGATVSIIVYNNVPAAVATYTEADIGSGISISGSVLTIAVPDLAGSTSHSIQITSGSIESLGATAWGGITDHTTWNFTTEEVFDFSDASVWFDFTDSGSITLNGADISAITNKGSGVGSYGSLSQGTAGNQPLLDLASLNGHDAVKFTSANSDVLILASGSGLVRNTAAFTLVGVAMVPDISVANPLFSVTWGAATDQPRFRVSQVATGILRLGCRRLDTDTTVNTSTAASAITNNTPFAFIIEADYSGQTTSVEIIGQTPVTGTPSSTAGNTADTNSISTPRLGTNNTGGSGAWVSSIAGWRTTLSSTRKQQFRDWATNFLS